METSPFPYRPLSLARVPSPFNGERGGFSTHGAGQQDILMQRKEMGSLTKPCSKNELTWYRNLHVTSKTIKLSEENIGVNLHGFGLQWLLSCDTKCHQRKNRHVGCHQFCNFCVSKGSTKRVKRQQPTEWEISANHLSDKALEPRK